MKKQSIFAAFAAVCTLSACGNKVSDEIRSTIKVNQTAASLAEWESSPSHPEVVFAKWRTEIANGDRSKLQSQICSELKALDGLALTIFEQEIKEEINQPLVMSCKKELLAQLERHYAAERATMKVPINALKVMDSGNDFQFPSNVQLRDVSNGYYARAGDVAPKEIILSFDDGPSEYTPSILRSLKEVNAKAHFFSMGKNIRRNVEIYKQVGAEGHAMGTHSVTHRCLTPSPVCQRLLDGKTLTYDEALDEIRGGHQAAYDVLGWVEPFFRFPYGEATPELRNFLKENSIAEFAWNMDSEDWRAKTNEEIMTKALAELQEKGRGIILFHDIQRRTAEILPQFLRELYNRGFSVVLLQPTDATARYNSKLVKKPVP
ncbi:MAG: polysaccharide deacetylase family protein [Bdellovibrio sp.]|nr:polysaccharide deacetylase family protein [Bdellovibrio sp.]